MEKKSEPKRRSGQEIEKELQGLKTLKFGKNVKKVSIPGFGKTHNWKKRSILYKLPYWKTNLLRNNLDVMHIEKNIQDSVVGTMMNFPDKTKDSVNARRDLKDMKIRKSFGLERRMRSGFMIRHLINCQQMT